MGLGKIARELSKVGLMFEALTYLVASGKAQVRAVKGAPGAGRDEDWSRPQNEERKVKK